MIVGTWHPGSGVGDQLFCYLAARIAADRLGVDFGMVGDFKGKGFLSLKRGNYVDLPYHIEMPAGKIVIEAGFPLFEGKRWYDPEVNFIEDNTIIDGCMMQDPRYFEGYWSDIREWLKTSYRETHDDLCIIGYRGGEYSMVPELYLQREYWEKAIGKMREVNPRIHFEVHTDDPARAQEMLGSLLKPETNYIHDVAKNWRSVRFAKYLIVCNSAFYIIPALLNQELKHNAIAPRYWARRNTGEWSLPQNYYKDFTYL